MSVEKTQINKYIDMAMDNLKEGYSGEAKNNIYYAELIIKNSEQLSKQYRDKYVKIIQETIKLILSSDYTGARYKIDSIKQSILWDEM